MNKRVIIGLIILISISLLGVVGIQIFWIRNAINVKNGLFTHSVNEAINKAASRIEMYQKIEFLNKNLLGNTLDMNMILKQSDEILDQAPVGVQNITPQITLNITTQSLLPTGSGLPGIGNYDDNSSQPYAPDQQNSILLQQPVPNQQGNPTQEMMDSLASPSYMQFIQARMQELGRAAEQMAHEIQQQSLNRKVEPELVKTILDQELRDYQIRTKYAFGIYRFDELLNSSEGFKRKDAFMVSLFPNDMLSRGFKLAVYFPDSDKYILGSIRGMLLLSLFLSFIILFTFSFSLYTVFKQKKISEMQSDFINNMTHEFKTPIATISVAADTIVNDRIVENPDQIKFFAGMIKKENKRMNQQVEKILRIARFERKDFEFRFEDTDVHELINRSVQSFSLQVEQRKGSVQFIPEAENTIITTDPTHFGGVINNLLDNANKYSKESPEIIVRTFNKNNGICISVQDNGIGMSRSVQSKIFERFYRQTTGDVHNVKGFGLGLSYVKAVVTANHGTISVQSEVGKGSTFEVYIPFAQS